MAASKKDIQRQKQQVSVGVGLSTAELDGTTTVEIIKFGGAMARVTFQGDGTLAGTVEFSVNGSTWFSSTAIAGTPTTYSTHNFNAMKVTRTSGTGKLSIAAT